MNDSDVEAVLRRYRPGGPPAHLRDRIVSGVQSRPIWPWAIAATLLLASAVTLRVAARTESAYVAQQLGPNPDTRMIDTLTDLLGGTADARDAAELTVMERRLSQEHNDE